MIVILFLFFYCSFGLLANPSLELQITNLQTEYKVNPLVIDINRSNSLIRDLLG